MSTAARDAEELLDACLTEAVVVLEEAEGCGPAEPRREHLLAQLEVAIDELESLLDVIEDDAPMWGDACDVVATARRLCTTGTIRARRAAPKLPHLAA